MGAIATDPSRLITITDLSHVALSGVGLRVDDTRVDLMGSTEENNTRRPSLVVPPGKSFDRCHLHTIRGSRTFLNSCNEAQRRGEFVCKTLLEVIATLCVLELLIQDIIILDK